jgi:hypothetical protein
LSLTAPFFRLHFYAQKGSVLGGTDFGLFQAQQRDEGFTPIPLCPPFDFSAVFFASSIHDLQAGAAADRR